MIVAKRKFAEGGGIGSYLKQKIGKAKTKHGVGLAFPMASMDKYVGNRHEGRMRVKRMADGGRISTEAPTGAQVRGNRDPKWNRLEGTSYGDGSDDQSGRMTFEPVVDGQIGDAVAKGPKKGIRQTNQEERDFNSAKRHRMAAGGLVGNRGDGIAQRGKTRARGCK